MKKGFSPFEIMIALAVGSLLGTALMQVLWQLGQSLNTVSRVSSVDMRMVVFQNLLEKELSGAFVPELVPIKDEDEQKAVPQKKEDNKKPPQAPQPQKQKKEKSIRVPKAFYSENNQDGTLKLLTFITVNPLVVYNVAKRRVNRIMYTFRPEQDKDTFLLYRQEDSDIMNSNRFMQQGQVKGFEVIGGIKSIRVEFLAKPEKKEQEEQKQWIRLPFWNVEKQEDAEQEPDNEDDTQKLPPLPQFIKMTVLLSDGTDREKEFVCTFAPNYGIEPVVLEGIKQMQAKSQQQRTSDKLGKVMDDNPLSGNLQDKFSQWQTPPPAPSGGPVTKGMGK